MSTTASTPTSETQSTPVRRGPAWANRLAIAGMLLLVLGPLVFVGSKREMAAWHAARGLDASWDDDHQDAIDHYNQALAWDPDNAGYLVLRAKAQLELGQTAEAIQDAHQATELVPDNRTAQSIYTTALLKAGRGQEAAAIYEDELPSFGIYDDAMRANHQNTIAVILATANIELDRASKHVDAALEYVFGQPAGDGTSILAETDTQRAYLDTRAMVRYRQGEYAKALDDMDKVLGDTVKYAEAIDRVVNETVADDRHRASELRRRRRELAQMLYHRALIHEALATAAKDDTDKRLTHEIQAVADRQQIRDLGFTPEESLF